jgi:SAM-dependent methyltransferase
MSIKEIHYDPLKAVLGKFISRNVLMRRLFYAALGMLFLRQWHVRAELKRLSREKNKWDIFDAGSGYGQYTYLMGKLFPQNAILAVDVKEEQVEDCNWFAQRVGQKNATFVVDDLTTFRKPDSFDLALSVDVMEHILEDKAVYANVFASLRNGGVFIVSTPTTTEEAPSHDEGEAFSVIGEHVRQGYTEKEFREKMTRAGFVVEKLKYTYGPVWGKLAWMILQRIPMLLLSTSKLLAIIAVPWMLVLYLPAALFMWLDVHSNNKHGGGWMMVARKG